MRPFQLLIFGASGFTGERVVENLVLLFKKSNLKSLRWAAAGRNEEKIRRMLHRVSQRTGVDVSNAPIVTASIDNDSSLISMASKSDLVMNCTGPFRETGEPVVSACVESRSNYLDIAGEPQFMEQTQLKYHSIAQGKGIYIVPGSGRLCTQ